MGHCWVVVVARAGREIPPSVADRLANPGRIDLPFPVESHRSWRSANARVAAAGWSGHATALDIGSFWHEEDGGVTTFGGLPWFGDRPWASSPSWASQLSSRLESFDVDRDIEELTGVFTLLHLGADGSGWATGDPLGLGHVYEGGSRDVTVVSNRAAIVADLVGATGRDLESSGLLALTGSMHGRRTGFQDVRALPQGTVLHIDQRGAVRPHTWATHPWSTDDVLSLEEAVDVAHDRLRRRVRLLAGTAAHRASCELTGGKDSRLVLGLLLDEGLAYDLTFRTWGAPGTPDVVAARQLADHFGLDLHADDDPRAPAARRRPVDDDGWRVRPMDYEAQLRHHLWASSGCSSFWALQRPTWPPASGLSLTGLTGEVLSTNYATSSGIRGRAALSWFTRTGGFGYDAAGIMHRDMAHHLYDVLVEEILRCRPPNGDLVDAIDGFYQAGRQRRWVGTTFELDERHRTLPLHDLAATRAAFAIGSRTRREEWFTFGLIERCNPDLVRIPFADDGWPEPIVASRPGCSLPPAPRSRRLPFGMELALRPVRMRVQRSANGRVLDRVTPRRTEPGVAEVNRMRGMAEKVTVLRSMLDLPVHHRIWEILDRRRTLAALDRIETLTTQGTAQLHHAATAAAWLDHGERWGDPYRRDRPPTHTNGFEPRS